jgi:hypothetical protein
VAPHLADALLVIGHLLHLTLKLWGIP